MKVGPKAFSVTSQSAWQSDWGSQNHLQPFKKRLPINSPHSCSHTSHVLACQWWPKIHSFNRKYQ